MTFNIAIKILPFGQVRLEIGKSTPHADECQVVTYGGVVRYSEPQETASRIYELQYGEKLTNYVVPLSTG